MASKSISNALLSSLRALALAPTRPSGSQLIPLTRIHCHAARSQSRAFSSTPRSQDWLLPRNGARKKTQKGRPQVNTGGSSRGTVLIHGDYGLRLKSHGGRLPAKQINIAVEAIKRRLRATRYRLYPRVTANVPVYTKGNEQRMGKGKGGFDYWCARVPHGRVILELGGEAHEQVFKEALRLASNKLPGQWEILAKHDREVVGTTRLKGQMTKEELYKPKRASELHPLHLLPDGRRAGEIAAMEQHKLDDAVRQFEISDPKASVNPSLAI